MKFFNNAILHLQPKTFGRATTEISSSVQIVNLYKRTLGKLVEKDDYNRRDEIQRTQKEQERLETL